MFTKRGENYTRIHSGLNEFPPQILTLNPMPHFNNKIRVKLSKANCRYGHLLHSNQDNRIRVKGVREKFGIIRLRSLRLGLKNRDFNVGAVRIVPAH